MKKLILFLIFLSCHINMSVFAQQIPPKVLQAYKKAEQYKAEGNDNEAIVYYQQAIGIYTEKVGSQDANYATLINNLAELYRVQGLYAKAEPLYLEAKAVREKALGREHPDYAQSCNNLALLYYNQGLYDKAEPLYLEAKAVREKALGREHPDYALSCNNLALLYYKQGLYSKAEPLYLEAKAVWEKVLGREHPDYATSCSSLASLYRGQGLYAKAEPLFMEAKAVLEKALGREHPSYAASCNNLAELYSVQGLYNKAEPLYLDAKTVKEKVLGREHPSYAASCNNLAGLYYGQGLYAKAEPLYLEAKAVREKVQGREHPDYAQSCNNLAVLYQVQGLYSKAEPLYLEAKAVREKVQGREHPDYAQSCNNLAVLYQVQGLYSKAEPLYLEAKAVREKVQGREHPDYANSCSNLGTLYCEQGLYSKAEPLHLEAKAIREKTMGRKHPDYARSCNNLAGLYREQGLYAKAEQLYLEVLENKTGQITDLLPSFSEAERKAFIQSIQKYFNNFYIFALQYHPQKPNIAADLFDLQLTTKGLLFNSTQKMQNRILGSGDQALIDKYYDWKAKNNYLARLLQMPLLEKQKQGIDAAKEQQLREEANRVEKELSQSSELFTQLGDKTRHTWQDIQKGLKPGEAALEIIRILGIKPQTKNDIDTLYAVLVVKPQTQNQPELVVLENGYDLENKYSRNYQNSIKQKLEDKISYSKYWSKIAEKLQGVTKVYFSADGVYHSISLGTLYNPQTGKYLADEIDIQLTGSSRDILKPNTVPKYTKKGTLIGFPDYNNGTKGDSLENRSLEMIGLTSNIGADTTQRFFDGKDISSLPGTKTEVENITTVFQNTEVMVAKYTETEATEGLVKSLQNPRILHIATHGFFLKDVAKDTSSRMMGIEQKNFVEDPLLRSGLLFANAKNAFKEGTEGVLTAREAMNLYLDETELVVLSACETGLGTVQNGEGVYGLQRAFQQAGAGSIIMSLWTVNDNSTQEMMTLFYQNWIQKKQTKKEAFKNAQNTLREKYPQPYYWGAFVMVGE